MENLDNMFEPVAGDDGFGGFEDVEDNDDQLFDDPQQPNEPKPYTPQFKAAYDGEETNLEDIFGDGDDNEENENISVLDKFLRHSGFSNSEITILDENNKEIRTNIHDLSDEEQLDILLSLTNKKSDGDLSENEAEWLNELRSNNLDFGSFLDIYRNTIIEEISGKSIDSYEIDSYDDKELFLLDLQNKYDLTDEELKQELEKELENEDLFAKKVVKLRQEYKSLEEQHKQMQAEEQSRQKEQEYNGFVNQMVDIAQNIPSFHGLELEDDDKNNTLSYMLDLDANGMSQLSRDLNDPQKLYEVAWYLKYGKDAFGIIENAYESEISRMKANRDKPSVVRQNTQSNRDIKNINELY